MRANYDKRRPMVTGAHRADRYTAQPRLKRPEKKAAGGGRTWLRRIVGALRPSLTEADRAAIYEAQNKRARRQARNIRWWSNDRTWEFYEGAR